MGSKKRRAAGEALNTEGPAVAVGSLRSHESKALSAPKLLEPSLELQAKYYRIIQYIMYKSEHTICKEYKMMMNDTTDGLNSP